MEQSELRDRLEVELARLQTWMNANDRAAALELGVGSAEDLQVMRMLLRDGPQRVGVLAQAQAASTATASARLDRLEKRGLITRDRVPGDRRAVVATLTDKGNLAARASRYQRLEQLEVVDSWDGLDHLQELVGLLTEPAAVDADSAS